MKHLTPAVVLARPWRGLRWWVVCAALSAAHHLACAQAAGAPAPKPAPAPPVPAAAPIVVEGRASDADSQRRQATVGTVVVGREELEAFGDTSVLDVLQRQPGISIEGEAPRLRGMGAGYTQILLNGEPAPPGFSLDSLAPGDIERIEIVKGPTAEFGAVAGTINVILRQAPRLQQREWRAALGYRAVRPQGSTAFNWGDRVGDLGFFLPVSVYSWANAADLQLRRVSRSATGEVSEQRVQGRDQWTGGGLNFAPRLDWKLNATDTAQWQGFAQRNDSRSQGQRDTVALQGPAPGSVHDESSSKNRWTLARTQGQWVRKTPEGTRLELKGLLQQSRSAGEGRAQGRADTGQLGVARLNLTQHQERTAALGARWRQPVGQAHTLNLGADVDERRRWDQRRQFNGGVEQFTATLGPVLNSGSSRHTAFVQDEWTPSEAWTWMLGLRAEQAVLRSSGPSGEVQGRYRALLPVAHLRHALDSQGRSLVRAGLARSLRLPDTGLLSPRYLLNGAYDAATTNTPIAADSAGNPLLQPEKAWGLDLAWEQHFAGGGVLSVGGFHRRIDGLIRRRIALETVAEASVPRWVSRPANLGSAHSSGLELELKAGADRLLAPVGWAAPKTLQLRAALSVFRSEVEQVDDPDARLDGQAPWTATLGFDHRPPMPGFSYGANVVLTPGFSTQQTDRQRVWRGAQPRLDLYGQWRLDRQTSLRLGLNNALQPGQRSSSRVEDLDGFAAGSETRRQNVAQFNAQFQTRF